MQPKLGLICTETLRDPILHAIQLAETNCQVTPLLYGQLTDLPELYRANHDRFDGFLITGSMSKAVIVRSLGEDTKPIQPIAGRSVEYYQEFFRLLSENRAVDFSRVYLESYFWLNDAVLRTAEDFIQRRTLVEKTLLNISRSLPVEMLVHADQLILDNARAAMERRELDLVVCRFSTAYQNLLSAGIPCSLVYPSPDNILDSLNLLLGELQLNQLSSSMPAVIFLSSPTLHSGALLDDVSSDSVAIQKCLLEFDQENTTGFLIKKAPHGFEIYTTLQVIRRLTDNFTSCQLRRFLYSRLGLDLNIGYGVGRDIMKARSYALEACASSRRDGQSYAITQNGSLVGPLDATSTRTVPADLPDKALNAAERSGLSNTTIQRILSAAELLDTNELTTQELASTLQVTVANANRFLNALVKAGQAHITAEKRCSAKGRPSRIYHLDFLT